MKNGSESVVHVSVAGVVSDRAKYPNKSAVPSLVPQWQRKAVSLVVDAWQGFAAALLMPFCVQQPVLIKAVSKLDPTPYRNAISQRHIK